MAHEHNSPITPGAGTVWCDEVGVLTGPLELRTTYDDSGDTTVSVRYQGADEWYRLRGGTCRLHDPDDAEALHQVLARVLHHPDA